MNRSAFILVAALSSAVTLAGFSTAWAAPPGEPLGAHVSECAHMALGERPDPPAVTCTHNGHVHSFATFGELVEHVREHHS